jgi:hypothetical protein
VLTAEVPIVLNIDFLKLISVFVVQRALPHTYWDRIITPLKRQ